jgi:hypothetical protein
MQRLFPIPEAGSLRPWSVGDPQPGCNAGTVGLRRTQRLSGERHPPLACALLTVAVKNEGRETFLTWWSTCGEPGMDFDLQKSDSSWEPLPPAPVDYRGDPRDLPACSRSFTYVEMLSPGKSHAEQIRLADPFLHLDTIDSPPPDDGFIHPHHPGVALLSAPGAHTIRVRFRVVGCVRSAN